MIIKVEESEKNTDLKNIEITLDNKTVKVGKDKKAADYKSQMPQEEWACVVWFMIMYNQHCNPNWIATLYYKIVKNLELKL